jgi:Lrp/AsnC family leucine-responsive transcriptional regulator
MVNLSAPADQRRIKRLEDTRVIYANVALVDPAKIGQSINLFVRVEMENERTDLYESAKPSFKNAPEVQQCYYVTGDTDFILVIRCLCPGITRSGAWATMAVTMDGSLTWNPPSAP